MMPSMTILEGDCLDVLTTLPDDSVNLIVTSPPYGKQRKHTYGGINPDQYVEWFLPRADEMRRVLRPDGSFVLNIKEHCEDGERHTYVYELVLAMRQVGWRWHEEWIWHKKNAYPVNWNYRMRDAWERIYQFTKCKDITVYREAVMIPVAEVTARRAKLAAAKGEKPHKTATDSGFNSNRAAWLNRDLVYPTNVLHMSAETHNQGHPAVFPFRIPRFFIKLFTVPGDTVLDPFAGSGTTLFQAYEMDRHSIGIEIMPEYCELMRERQSGLTVRLPGLDESALGGAK